VFSIVCKSRGEIPMRRQTFVHGLIAAAAGLGLAGTARAVPAGRPFYYPVAVGGPITKVIDGYAADFNKAHPQ
jgi:sn-glycerol 3-phosphate transport system substrate-binding protein